MAPATPSPPLYDPTHSGELDSAGEAQRTAVGCCGSGAILGNDDAISNEEGSLLLPFSALSGCWGGRRKPPPNAVSSTQRRFSHSLHKRNGVSHRDPAQIPELQLEAAAGRRTNRVLQSGWRSLAYPGRKASWTEALNEFHRIETLQPPNRFTRILLLYRLFWNIDYTLSRATSQVDALREWLTFFISPLISIDRILQETGLEKTLRKYSSDNLGNRSRDTLQADSPQERNSAVPRNDQPDSLDHYNGSTSKRSQTATASCPSASPGNDPHRGIPSDTVVRWVCDTFPFIKPSLITEELWYLQTFAWSREGSNPSWEPPDSSHNNQRLIDMNSGRNSSPARSELSTTGCVKEHDNTMRQAVDTTTTAQSLTIDTRVLKLFLNKQLPLFLEEELENATQFLNKFKELHATTLQATLQLRSDIRHQYIALVGSRLNLHAASSISLRPSEVQALFNATDSSYDISRCIAETLSKAPALPYLHTLSTLNSRNDKSEEGNSGSHVSFLSRFPSLFSRQQETHVAPNRTPLMLTTPRRSCQHRPPTPLMPIGPKHAPASPFPPPPIPPRPTGIGTSQDQLTMKTVDTFLQRCAIDIDFFRLVWKSYCAESQPQEAATLAPECSNRNKDEAASFPGRPSSGSLYDTVPLACPDVPPLK